MPHTNQLAPHTKHVQKSRRRSVQRANFVKNGFDVTVNCYDGDYQNLQVFIVELRGDREFHSEHVAMRDVKKLIEEFVQERF